MRSHLEAEFERLQSANPFAALGLGPTATPAEIRAAFLAQTKRYHPSRYARMERDVVRLANEVFLRKKDAYTTLGDARKRERWAAQLAPAAPVGPSAGSGPGPSASSGPGPSAGSGPGPGGAKVAADSGSGAVAPPAPERPAPSTRARRPSPARPRPGSSHKIARPASVRGIRPGTAPVGKGRAATVRPRPPSDASELATDLQDSVRARNDDYESALRLIARGDYKRAREVLQQVAIQDPKTKKYRVQLHYAWGLEHEAAQRYDDARAELQRAINADPTFKRAHEALDKLPGKKGFFSKLFGK